MSQSAEMTTQALLHGLKGVRTTSNRWMALCPAHDDMHPSLSIRQGDNGILLKCWAGCSLDDICVALGITMKDLFYDNHQQFDGRVNRQRSEERALQPKREKAALLIDARRIDEYRHAELTIQALTGVDISGWMAKQLDEAMNKACDAHIVLLDEERSIEGETSNVIGF